MARINIEESLFKDVRFDELKMKLGSVDTALGAIVRAWSLAQVWYLKQETSRLIPVYEWKKQRINDAILEVGLAEVRENGIYVCGSEDQFAWLIQRQEAGKKGGRPPNRNKQQITKGPANPEKVPLRAESGSNPLSLSLSLSPSLSLNSNSDSFSEEGGIKKATEARLQSPHPLIEIWNQNCGALAKVKLSNKKRDKLMAVRWKELDGLQWVTVVKKLSESNFCNGKNDRGWKADFDFLLKPDTWTKALEGRYDNRSPTQSGMTEDGRYLTPAMKRSHNNLAMFKKLNGGSDDEKPTERDVESSLSDG